MSPPKLETQHSSFWFELLVTACRPPKNLRARAVPPNPRTSTGPPRLVHGCWFQTVRTKIWARGVGLNDRLDGCSCEETFGGLSPLLKSLPLLTRLAQSKSC